MIHDVLDHIADYRDRIPHFESVYRFLSSVDLDLLPTEIFPHREEDWFCLLAEYETHEFEETQYEIHRDFLDIQLVVKGEERIFVTPAAELNFEGSVYDSDKDIQFGTAELGEFFLLKRDSFMVFFPVDGHQPGCHSKDLPLPVTNLTDSVVFRTVGLVWCAVGFYGFRSWRWRAGIRPWFFSSCLAA